jgi:DNA-directed RNA polymerase subunit beta'
MLVFATSNYILFEWIKIEELKYENLYEYYYQRRKYSNKVRIINYFIQHSFKPTWMLIKFLPVLPPNLRPVVKLENNITITTDLNFLYLNILRINKLLAALEIAILNQDLLLNDKLLLQSSIDKLINNEKSKDIKSILGPQKM